MCVFCMRRWGGGPGVRKGYARRVSRSNRARASPLYSQRKPDTPGGETVAAVKARRNARFPGETADYRRARNRLLKSEVELRRQIESVAAQRRKLPLGGEVREDYVFEALPAGEKKVKKVRLSQLFHPGKDTLFLSNFLFPESVDSMTPFPSSTSIIDAVDGAARHVRQRINFVVVAKATSDRFTRHARSRGWRHTQLLSPANH